jgi:hypothetical protein
VGSDKPSIPPSPTRLDCCLITHDEVASESPGSGEVNQAYLINSDLLPGGLQMIFEVLESVEKLRNSSVRRTILPIDLTTKKNWVGRRETLESCGKPVKDVPPDFVTHPSQGPSLINTRIKLDLAPGSLKVRVL